MYIYFFIYTYIFIHIFIYIYKYIPLQQLSCENLQHRTLWWASLYFLLVGLVILPARSGLFLSIKKILNSCNIYMYIYMYIFTYRRLIFALCSSAKKRTFFLKNRRNKSNFTIYFQMLSIKPSNDSFFP